MYTRVGLGQADALISAIITQEGTCPSPSNCSNNNPGNLVYAGQPGASGVPGQIATFDTYQDGYNALVSQLGLYASGNCAACAGQPQTLSSMFQIYAPASVPGNNPTIYASNVAGALGVPTSTPVSSILATPSGSPASTADLSPDLSSVISSGVNFDPTTLILVGSLAAGLFLLLKAF